MNVLSDAIMQLISSVQMSIPAYACAGSADGGSAYSAYGCRNACSGSCEGSCDGSCDRSCFGGCEGIFGYEDSV